MTVEEAMRAVGIAFPEEQGPIVAMFRAEGPPANPGELSIGFDEDVTAEELTTLLTATMAKVAELPDFDPLAFQGQLMAAMTQGVGG